jgi:hypothetical protein
VFEHAEKPGKPLCGTSLYRRYAGAAKRADLPVLRFHDRTQAIRVFSIYEVQRMMGHRQHHDDRALPALRPGSEGRS